ncbi:MAG: glycosyltransferase family 2 protein [Phycisphaeraceae bacterium]|nr:glycosyltransferase family 2 protein [Phycisphaeraceae bacterium]
MNQTPDVAVVITTYNRPDFLPETIDSVLAQDYQGQLDILVVDDGSTDNTAEVVRPYTLKHVDPDGARQVRYHRQSNQGLAMARNAGVAHTIAPLICFVDDDDLCEPAKVRRQVELFVEDAEVGLAHTSFRYIDRDGAYCDEGPQRADNPCVGWCVDVLLNELMVISSTVMVRRDVLLRAAAAEEHGLPYGPEWVRSQDYDMALRMARLSKFAYIPEPMLRYRLHDGNIAMSQGNIKRAYGFHCRVQLSFARRYGSEIGVNEAEAKKRVANFLDQRAESFYWQRKLDLCRQMCELAEEMAVADGRFDQWRQRASRPAWLLKAKDWLDRLRKGRANQAVGP